MPADRESLADWLRQLGMHGQALTPGGRQLALSFGLAVFYLHKVRLLLDVPPAR
jgi:hypothetical protein